MWYRGWTIDYYPFGSQHWRGRQHGVEVCSNTQDSVKRVIDLHIEDRKTWFEQRGL